LENLAFLGQALTSQLAALLLVPRLIVTPAAKWGGGKIPLATAIAMIGNVRFMVSCMVDGFQSLSSILAQMPNTRGEWRRAKGAEM
jgi:hypothetical protein